MNGFVPNGTSHHQWSIAYLALVRHFHLWQHILILYLRLPFLLLILVWILIGVLLVELPPFDPLALLVELRYLHVVDAHGVQVVGLAVPALVHVRILRDRLVARFRTLPHSNKQTHIKVHCKG